MKNLTGIIASLALVSACEQAVKPAAGTILGKNTHQTVVPIECEKLLGVNFVDSDLNVYISCQGKDESLLVYRLNYDQISWNQEYNFILHSKENKWMTVITYYSYK